MERFFDPKSVVVVGASNTAFNLGATICNMLKDYLSYTGAVYAVNSKGEAVNGCSLLSRCAPIFYRNHGHIV